MVTHAGVRMTNEFGAYMRRLRLLSGFETADDVMRESGQPPRITAHAIRAIERGNVDRPKVETLEVLAELYNVARAELLYRAGYLPAESVSGNREEEFSGLFRGLTDQDQQLAVTFLRKLRAASRLTGDEGPSDTPAPPPDPGG